MCTNSYLSVPIIIIIEEREYQNMEIVDWHFLKIVTLLKDRFYKGKIPSTANYVCTRNTCVYMKIVHDAL